MDCSREGIRSKNGSWPETKNGNAGKYYICPGKSWLDNFFLKAAKPQARQGNFYAPLSVFIVAAFNMIVFSRIIMDLKVPQLHEIAIRNAVK